jgi:molybdopterin/thiamine biosynthesis adenylyltransferase
MSEILNRQKLIEGINNEIKVLVIGAGGIGFHVAKLLAMSGVEEIHVFDPDVLEVSNLNRLDLTPEYVGKNKADIVKTVIGDLREDCTVRAFPFPLKDHTYPKGVDWVIDCTDNHKSQLENEKMAQKNGAKYMKAGYDGERMALNNRVAQWDTNDDDVEGYRTTPSWAVPAIIIAALAVGKVLKYHDQEMGCHLKELYS